MEYPDLTVYSLDECLVQIRCSFGHSPTGIMKGGSSLNHGSSLIFTSSCLPNSHLMSFSNTFLPSNKLCQAQNRRFLMLASIKETEIKIRRVPSMESLIY
ncbi:uncharacterized protein DS421_17g582330 [Arachis hypogaea]|nr:uncharacterized protein DS421_17g582330 [Arachis hypogaea]